MDKNKPPAPDMDILKAAMARTNKNRTQGQAASQKTAISRIAQSLAEVVSDPCWQPCALDIGKGKIQFAYVDKETVERETFLDSRFFSVFKGRFILVDLHELIQAVEEIQLAPPAGFIFHTAFCGSTLIAKNVAAKDDINSILEPNILLDLALIKRKNRDFYLSSTWEPLLKTIVLLLARPYIHGGKSFIKPTNSVNNLIKDLMELFPETNFLLLYSGLKEFMVSNIKKSFDYTEFCQILISTMMNDNDFVAKNKLDNFAEFPSLNLAATAWIIQLEEYQVILNECKSERIGTLNFRDYLRDVDRGLKSCYEFLDIETTNFQSIIAGTQANKHSKSTKHEYNREVKAGEDSKIVSEHGEEIDRALSWADQFDYGKIQDKLEEISIV